MFYKSSGLFIAFDYRGDQVQITIFPGCFLYFNHKFFIQFDN